MLAFMFSKMKFQQDELNTLHLNIKHIARNMTSFTNYTTDVT